MKILEKIKALGRAMHEHAVLIFVIWPLAILLAPITLALFACRSLAEGGETLLQAMFRPLHVWEDHRRIKLLVAQALRA